MTKLLHPTLLLLTTTLFAAAACGDDDDSDGTTDPRGGSSSAGRGGSTAGSSNDSGAGGSLLGGSPAAGGAGAGGDPSVSGGGGGAAGGLGGVAGEGGVAGAPAAELTDAQVLLVLDTLNQGEIEMAYAALPGLVGEPVRDFAQLMITHHGAGRQEVLSVAEALELSPQPSEVQAALHAKADQVTQELRDSEADVLDESYVTSQVTAHAEALTLLDELAATSDAEELQDLIAMLKPTVETHYETAVMLAAELP